MAPRVVGVWASATLVVATWTVALAQGVVPTPPGAEKGTIAGTVTDKVSGEPIIDAGVEVVDQKTTVRTDIDGKFVLHLPPGTYQVRMFAPLHQPVRLQRIVVKPNQVARADAALPATAAGVDVVEVIAQADKAAEATQLQRRRKSASVSDTVSAETIKKSPDSDAGEVVKRVPAVTVKDDKFIYVRGLGERYSSALLNGSRLPSTDPEKRVVPLDLFPADFLESLSIIKTYTPDLPGDFSGGLADISLREFPEKLSYSVGIAGGGNTQTTFQDFLSYKGANFDYLGTGLGYRKLPNAVPDFPTGINNASNSRFAIGRAFRDIWSAETETALPNTGFNFSVGNTWGPLGLSVGGIYTTEYKHHTEIDRQFIQAGTPGHPEAIVGDDFTYSNNVFETRVGAVATAGYKIADNHKITVHALLDRNSYDEVLAGVGTTEQFHNTEAQTQLRYTVEELAYGQVVGEHQIFPWLHFDWRSAYSRTTQDVPDNRYTTYIESGAPGSPLRFSEDSLGGSRIFGDLHEILSDSAADVTIPFTTGLPGTDVWSGLPGKFKFGPAYSYRDRDFTQRRFRYRIRNAQAIDLTLPPEEILNPFNIQPGLVNFEEETVPRDQFSAQQRIYGAYGMTELPLLRDNLLRLVTGLRVENSYIVLHTFDDQGDPQKVIKNDTDPLPAATLIASPWETMNFRLSWSKTVSRPEFRELSPAFINQPRGLRPFVGNPDLVETKIDNYDFRWEWFFSPLELASVSYFRKTFDQPIEAIALAISSGRPVDSVTNSESAELQGFEVEGRKNFGFVWHRLRDLSLLANIAYIDSTVQVGAKQGQVQTSKERALQGQAPYIVNAALDYTSARWGSVRLLYNTAGSRIFRAGTFGLPDLFEEPRNELDAVVIVPVRIFGTPFTIKGAAENLLDDPVLITQGGQVQSTYTTGIKVSLGISYSF